MWTGIPKYKDWYLDYPEKIFERLPKLLLAAKTEEAIVRLLALQYRLNRTRNFDWEDICFKRQVFSTKDLAKNLDEAVFKTLPQAYQNDDVLEFFYKNGELYARPKQDQIFALGEWESRFNNQTKTWEGIKSSEGINNEN